MNFYSIKGNLGKDPVFRQTPNGKTVADISVATNDGYGDKKKVNWHNVVAWGFLADSVKDAKKGSSIFVSGQAETQSWEDKKTGEKKYKTVLIAKEIGLIAQGNSPVENGVDTSDHFADVPF